ncbi:MAG: T9SS type A sorting domain-containing protein [Bacteroidales bacterium]|nr:T9SS type A sorting domain-containing protein [Bacteroidales bacterium]
MKKYVFHLLFLMLVWVNLSGQATYFWTGGTGYWSEPANWSLENGTPAGNIPSETTHVVFNESSFLFDHDTVFVDSDQIYCKDMLWENLLYPVIFYGDNTQELHIFGSIKLNSLLQFLFPGKIIFASNQPGNTIKLNEVAISGDIYFSGETGEWTLMDDLLAENDGICKMYFEHGTLNTNGNEINIASIFSNNSNPRTLDITNSGVNLSQSMGYAFLVNGENLTLFTDNSEISTTGTNAIIKTLGSQNLSFDKISLLGVADSLQCQGNQIHFQRINLEGIASNTTGNFQVDSMIVNGNGCSVSGSPQIGNLLVNGISFKMPGGLYIERFVSFGAPILSGSNHYGYASFTNEALFLSDNTFDTLIFQACCADISYNGGHYHFKPGTTQTVNDSLRIRGNQCFNITLHTTLPDTGYAWIKKDYGEYDIQCDYLNIDNIAVESATLQFYAGNNSTFYPGFYPLPGWTAGNNNGYFFGFGGMHFEACVGDTVSLDASCFNGDQYTEYYWNGDSIPGNITFEVIEPQTVHIYVKYADNCYIADYAIVEFDSCASNIPEITNNKLFEVYPNPSSGVVTVRLKNSVGRTIFTLGDLSGRVVYRNESILKGPHAIHEFDFSNIIKGIYYLKIEDSEKIAVQTVILH